VNNLFKRFSCFLLIALMTGNIVIHAGETPSPPAGTEPPPSGDAAAVIPAAGVFNVRFDVTPRQDKGKLYFDVETNLPDGMRFMASIRDEYGFICKIGSTMERIDIDVENGKMAVGPFPFHGHVFPAGEYKFYISTYPAENQPKTVVAVIGENGARLSGPDVVEGILAFGKEFMITGQE
jgi:hypothetical protein